MAVDQRDHGHTKNGDIPEGYGAKEAAADVAAFMVRCAVSIFVSVLMYMHMIGRPSPPTMSHHRFVYGHHCRHTLGDGTPQTRRLPHLGISARP